MSLSMPPRDESGSVDLKLLDRCSQSVRGVFSISDPAIYIRMGVFGSQNHVFRTCMMALLQQMPIHYAVILKEKELGDAS